MEKPKFQVSCNAGEAGQFCCATERMSITVGHRVLREGREQMWDSVVVLCQEETGIPTIRVVVCHPDWDEPLDIACIRSRPDAGVEVQFYAQPDGHSTEKPKAHKQARGRGAAGKGEGAP